MTNDDTAQKISSVNATKFAVGYLHILPCVIVREAEFHC